MRNLATTVVLISSLLAGQDSKKAPVPDEAAQKEAEKLIRDIFKDEYARTSAADRVELARKLLEQGRQSSDDPASRYVLLREARDVAAQAANCGIAFEAVDEMDRFFEIDAPSMKVGILSASAKKAKTPEELKEVVDAFLSMADAAISADDYEAAAKAAGSAMPPAKRAKDAALAARVEAKMKEISELKAQFEPVRKAREKLASNPDDPQANLAVGRFLCLVRGSWEAGLPLLAKGSDGTLKALAEKELAMPGDASAQAELGDGWWDAADKESRAAKAALRERAIYWYKRAVEGLTGLARTKVEKRLSEIRKEKSGGWEELNDPELFGVEGRPGDPIELAAAQGGANSASVKDFPEGEFDGVSARLRFGKGDTKVLGALILDPVRFAACIDPGQSYVYVNRGDGKKWSVGESADIPERTEYVLTVLIIGGEYVVYVDGKEKLRYKARAGLVTTLSLMAQSGTATFDRIRLRYR